MHDLPDLMLSEHAVEQGAIEKRSLHHAHARIARETYDVRALQSRIVERIEIVQANHARVRAAQQALDQVAANEPSAPGHQNSHASNSRTRTHVLAPGQAAHAKNQYVAQRGPRF